jgi:hypothetical protein
MEFCSKTFEIADIVKFVPYYTSSGMQGATLKMKMPDHNCYALVIANFKNQVRLLMPYGSKKLVNNACIETIITLSS